MTQLRTSVNQEFNWKYDGDTVRTSSCTEHVHITLDSNYLLEQPNVASRCFEHKQPWTVQHCDVTHTVSDWGSGCYQVCELIVYAEIKAVVNGIKYITVLCICVSVPIRYIHALLYLCDT